MIARAPASNVLSLLLGIMLLVACGQAEDSAQPQSGTRNVILLIGDGFGSAQMSLGMQYATLVEKRELHIATLMRDGNTGYAQPLPFNSIVIDSAAAASQMATGQQVRNDTLGLDPNGYPIETILEWAHARDLGTGLVTNMRITHATPAAFAVHQRSRYDSEQVLMDDLLQQRDADVLLGGGARALVPAGSRVSEFLSGVPADLDSESIRDDEVNWVEELASHGYVIASDSQSLQVAADHATKLLGVFSASHLPLVLDRQQMNVASIPTLAEMTSAALDVLARHDSGFFLMVEGGRIDSAGHANDAGVLLHEVLEFDQAVGAALEFQRDNPDTLVLVAGDHATGGFSFTDAHLGPADDLPLESGIVYQPGRMYPYVERLETLFRQSASYSYILKRAGGDADKLVDLVLTHTGLEMTKAEAKAAFAIDELNPYHGSDENTAAATLGRVLARHSYVVWSTGEHTSELVPTYGRGPGAEKLRGLYPFTHLYSVMRENLEAGL